jgi:hypothetical protein
METRSFYSTPSKVTEKTGDPLAALLLEVRQILARVNLKPEVLKAIEKAFSRRQSSLLSTTLNLWYRKYELEAHERSRTERRLTLTIEANKILSAQVARTSLLLTPSGLRENNTSIEDGSLRFQTAVRGDQETPRKVLVTQKTEPIIKDCDSEKNGFEFQPYSSVDIGPCLDSEKACPLCSKQLHAVYQELEQKTQKIAELNSTIHKMTQKGQILISQAKMLTSENSRLEQLNQDLQDTMRHLEQHLTKSIGENNLARKNHLAVIDEKHRENSQLSSRIKELEGLLERYSQRDKLDHYLAQHQKNSPGRTGVLGSSGNSSVLVQKLLDENTHLHQGNGELRRPLIALKKEICDLSFSYRKPDSPSSELFLEELSKIHLAKADAKMSADDETIQKFLQVCDSPDKAQDVNQTKVTNKPQTQSPGERPQPGSTPKKANAGRPAKRNAGVNSRPPCECRLM